MKVSALLAKHVTSAVWRDLLDSPAKVLYLAAELRLKGLDGEVEKVDTKKLMAYLDKCADRGVDTRMALLDVALLQQAAKIQGFHLPTAESVHKAYEIDRKEKSATALPPRRFCQVEVQPKSWGTEYRPLEGFDGAFNRQLSTANVRDLLDNWESVEAETTLVLLQDESDGTFYVLDGQHRVFVASEKRDVASTFWAEIRDPAQFWSSLADQVKNLQLGKRFQTSDFFVVNQTASWWPGIFARYEIIPTFKPHGAGFSWKNVIIGYAYYKYGMSAKATKPEVLAKVWSGCAASYVSEIESVAEALTWWKEGADLAEKSGSKIMHSSAAIAFALTLYYSKSNEASTPSLLAAPKRLAKWSGLKDAQGLTAARGQDLWPYLLKGINSGTGANGANLLSTTAKLVLDKVKLDKLDAKVS